MGKDSDPNINSSKFQVLFVFSYNFSITQILISNRIFKHSFPDKKSEDLACVYRSP